MVRQFFNRGFFFPALMIGPGHFPFPDVPCLFECGRDIFGGPVRPAHERLQLLETRYLNVIGAQLPNLLYDKPYLILRRKIVIAPRHTFFFIHTAKYIKSGPEIHIAASLRGARPRGSISP